MRAKKNPAPGEKGGRVGGQGVIPENVVCPLLLLVMPEAERRWRRRDEDEEPVEDSYDRFISRGQKPY